jgi:hypothetical protein
MSPTRERERGVTTQKTNDGTVLHRYMDQIHHDKNDNIHNWTEAHAVNTGHSWVGSLRMDSHVQEDKE